MNKTPKSCYICNAQYNSNFKILNSRCRLSNTDIVRYQCNKCGIIFGPLNLINATFSELSKEYQKIFDSGYKDADNTDLEIKVFKYLNPNKKSLYLNWGCGTTPKTIQKLNELGYSVLGYEPFNQKQISNKLVISDFDKLSKYKFDGIFSNNLLEHLQNPVSTLINMTSILKNKESYMVHATPCYKYVYEWTKFHLYFFVNNSLNEISKLTKLNIKNTDNDDIKIFEQI